MKNWREILGSNSKERNEWLKKQTEEKLIHLSRQLSGWEKEEFIADLIRREVEPYEKVVEKIKSIAYTLSILETPLTIRVSDEIYAAIAEGSDEN